MSDQQDLFPELPRDETVNPEEVRAELLEILRIAREARDEAPWDRRTHQFHAVVFPQMARWLPHEEAEQLCLQFEAELERLEGLLAA
jgi:hypothetical protein